MSWSFNPFTGNLDLVGSGGGSTVFEGEVATFADLPVTIGDPAVGAAYLVRDSTGVWLVNRRQAGIYIRRNNTGVAATDWEYGGDYPVNSVNNQTGNVVLAAADVGAAAVTHASTHFTGGSDALAAHQINGQTIFSTISATYSSDQTLTANRARQLTISNTNASGINITLPTGTDGTLLGDTYVIIGGNQVDGTITIRALVNVSPPIYTTLATINSTGEQYRFRASGGTSGGWSLVPVDSHTHAASDVNSGTFDNARINFAAPAAIGSTTPAAGTFTTLAANNGTLTASAPVLDLAQTWNDSGTKFTAFKLNATNTASNVESILADFQVDGVSIFSINDNGVGINGGTWVTFSETFASAVLMGGVWYVNNGIAFNVAASRGPLSCVAQLGANQSIGWSSNNQPANANADLRFHREGAGILGQRNGTNAQEFRLYNTWTSASNYEALAVKWAANVVSIGPTAGGSGGTVRELHISGLPTSNPGPGILWNDSGTVKVGT